MEKLIYPLSWDLWAAICFCFFVGLVVIAVIKRLPRFVEKFVFGTRVTHPYLNLFTVFIGGNQKQLPGRNFARFLLTMFLIYSFIIRTVYQASFFNLLNSNQRHKEVKSINEMIDKNFDFFVDFGTKDLLEGNQGINQRFVKVQFRF
jgi:hypothetical protein